MSLPYLSLGAKILMFRDSVNHNNLKIVHFNIRRHILLLFLKGHFNINAKSYEPYKPRSANHKVRKCNLLGKKNY